MGLTVPSAPARNPKGQFLPGHRTPQTHGLHASAVAPVYLEMSGALLEQSITDDGGAENIPARRLSQHEYRALIHRQIWQLSDALDARGHFDKRGKLRCAWLQRLESLVNLAAKLDASLGLERRTKPVTNPADWLEGKA